MRCIYSSNIAEGSGRNYDKEFVQFCELQMGQLWINNSIDTLQKGLN
jgi:hypothetical protein